MNTKTSSLTGSQNESRPHESGDPVSWFEIFESAADAIKREKQLKKWNRAWKLALIEKLNPG